MKIAIVISTYNRSGGLERVAVEYARGLCARGHDITVFAQRVEREQADEGVRFVRVGGVRSQIAMRAATFPFAATRAVKQHRFDNIISFGSSVLVPAVVALPGAHRSWWEVANHEWPVTTVDGLRRRLNPHHRVVLALDRRVLGSGMPRAVLASGDWAADDIRRFYPKVAHKVHLLPEGVNFDEFRFDAEGRAQFREKHGITGEQPLLFTLATELRRKGLSTLLEAFRIVLEQLPDARLLIGGKAPAGDVRALAVNRRVGREARAIGFVRDLSAAYSGADVLVFPTRFDPWGLPIAEALACGTPVAASARAGAASAIEPGVTGTLIGDPSDAIAVARATLDAAALKPDREAARASIEHLRWEVIVAELETILERTAE
jgi:UDP-glucose:(heptosyl)LPS alpha-1,3-glucosyltransferase